MNIIIEKFKDNDISSVHLIWNEVIDEGQSFFWKEHFGVDKITNILKNQDAVYCAKDNEAIIGFYILHSNFPRRGDHISNVLYAIRRNYRGRGIGKMLGKHSLEVSKNCGYKAMQFNSVVSTNTASVRLWKSRDFIRVGQIERAFVRDNGESSDIYIYHKEL